ncbi:MAG: hypothetical protein P4L58_02260, partial [Candidatus Pacebacteria bacterium]|nr:hypothetical protein [Candidatus Paceibacterota bacterium]
DQMEQAIQALLKESGRNVAASLSSVPDQTPQNYTSPETYIGSAKMQYYFPSGSLGNGTQTFSLSDNLSPNSFSYGGTWTINDEYAVAGSGATLNYNFIASKVYIILNSDSSAAAKVRVLLDGKIIDPAEAGADVKDSTVTVDTDRLYNIVDLHGKTESHILKLEFQTPGTQAYTFTFG